MDLERLQWTVDGERLTVKDHLIEIIKAQLIELLYDIFVEALGEHVLIKNSSARDWGEPDFNEPLPGLEMRDMKQTVCS